LFKLKQIRNSSGNSRASWHAIGRGLNRTLRHKSLQIGMERTVTVSIQQRAEQTGGGKNGFHWKEFRDRNDGHDSPCVDGEPGGLVSADAFLRQWVPQILSSPAYQRDGLLLILFDEAEFSGSSADSTACCHEVPGPNSPLPGITGPGGGRVGAVVLSRFVRAGTVITTPYNHYSLFRTIEDLFGLDHLGFAGQSGLDSFGLDVFITVP
jgi:hypothetical protein